MLPGSVSAVPVTAPCMLSSSPAPGTVVEFTFVLATRNGMIASAIPFAKPLMQFGVMTVYPHSAAIPAVMADINIAFRVASCPVIPAGMLSLLQLVHELLKTSHELHRLL